MEGRTHIAPDASCPMFMQALHNRSGRAWSRPFGEERACGVEGLREAADLVREASQRLFEGDPELLLPGGNAYTTRRLAACLRDMDYFLRYASYALVADDSTILNERVLNGLDDTYKSLGVPTGPTVRSMILLADVLCERLVAEGLNPSDCLMIRKPFDHLASGLSASDVRQR